MRIQRGNSMNITIGRLYPVDWDCRYTGARVVQSRGKTLGRIYKRSDDGRWDYYHVYSGGKPTASYDTLYEFKHAV